MIKPVLILGACGNFGKRIAKGLTQAGVPVILAGRDRSRLKALSDSLLYGLSEIILYERKMALDPILAKIKPHVVINTIGPFQEADLTLPRACIASGVHYIDLSDGRDYVKAFTELDEAARAADLSVITGASTVPCLSSAVIEAYRSQFESLDHLDFGICPGQGAERGLATTQAILSYVGKPLAPYAGVKSSYGWQGLRGHRFPNLGLRLISDCDIPDLDLLPQAYGLKSVRFGAGLELWPLHLGLWGLSWLVRWGLIPSLKPLAKPMLQIADLFNGLGSDDGGMFMRLTGTGLDQKAKTINWHIEAFKGDGPHIPTIAAILLAQLLVSSDNSLKSGAMSAMGLIGLEAYIEALKAFNIQVSYEPK